MDSKFKSKGQKLSKREKKEKYESEGHRIKIGDLLKAKAENEKQEDIKLCLYAKSVKKKTN